MYTGRVYHHPHPLCVMVDLPTSASISREAGVRIDRPTTNIRVIKGTSPIQYHAVNMQVDVSRRCLQLCLMLSAVDETKRHDTKELVN